VVIRLVSGAIVFCVLFPPYFSLTIFGRNTGHVAKILSLDLFVGWTVIGWFAGLSLAVKEYQPQARMV